MPQFDLPLDQLERYLPDEQEPADFDAFWADTLDETREFALDPRFEDAGHFGYRELIVQDVSFSGYGGERVRGWFLAPRHRTGPLPTVVTFEGYGGGRGLPGAWTAWPSAGFAHLVMDSRGQGSGHRSGDTRDGATGPHAGGVLTLGIHSPHDYYYRRLFTDAVRAVDAALQHPLVDPTRLTIAGASQGGGTTLAVAALHRSPVAALIDVPFLSNVRRAIRITDSTPYAELVRWLHTHRGQEGIALDTVDYFDGIHFASRATAPAIFSVGLMDQVCPPSTVYAAFNRYAGAKEMRVYPYNGHEHGGEHQAAAQLQWLREQLTIG